MAKCGPAFHDDDSVFAAYRRTREAWPDNPNDTLEQPIMTELVGDLVGRRILDLGCGAAAFGVRAFAAGAQSYLGVDGSRNMIDRASASLRDGGGAVVLETWRHRPRPRRRLTLSSLPSCFTTSPTSMACSREPLPPSRREGNSSARWSTPCSPRPTTGGGPGRAPTALWTITSPLGDERRRGSGRRWSSIIHHRRVEAYVAALQGAGFIFERLRVHA
jgi:hypothetical protein